MHNFFYHLKCNCTVAEGQRRENKRIKLRYKVRAEHSCASFLLYFQGSCVTSLHDGAFVSL